MSLGLWVSCCPSVMAKTVELRIVWETADSKFGLDTGCATRVFGFIFYPSGKVPVGLRDGRNEIRRETLIFTPFPVCYSLIIPPFVLTDCGPEFNLVY